MRSAQLTAFMSQLDGRPFDWSTWNCCQFASSWCKYATDRDPMAEVISDGRLGAVRQVLRRGKDLRSATSVLLGQAEILISMAQPGDFVFAAPKKLGDLGSLGICNGRTSFYLMDTGGVMTLPTLQAECAWKLDPR